MTTHADTITPTVTRTPADQWTAEIARVCVLLSSGTAGEVFVYGPNSRFDGYEAARINWSGIGLTNAEDALAYAGAIALAAAIAPTLTPATGDV